MDTVAAFSLLQFNMQYGQPWIGRGDSEPESDINQTIAFLQENRADIIVLQEVEHACGGTTQIEPPPHFSRLQHALQDYYGYFAYPEPHEDELPFGIGQAILSRYPLSAMTRRTLPAPDLEFSFNGRAQRPAPRLLIGARADMQGCHLEIFNAHLQAFFMIGSSSDEHPAQRESLLAEVAHVKLPTLVAGDFNCSPRESLVDSFERAGFRPCQNKQVTWKRKPYVLDHVFHNEHLECRSAEVIRTDVSDHHALRVTLAFRDS